MLRMTKFWMFVGLIAVWILLGAGSVKGVSFPCCG
jgi:hypothetical protein